MHVVDVLFSVRLLSLCPEIVPRWAHEYVPSAALSGILWHAKDFDTTCEVGADVTENRPVVIQWLKLSTQMASCLYDHSQV